MNENIIEFLKESNNIEDVWDDDSLVQAIYAWNYLIKKEELTMGVILKTHKILMLHQIMQPNERGFFRKRPIWIGGYEAKLSFHIPKLIKNWCDNVKVTITDADINGKDETIKWIKQDHINYEAIHPFIDGNGRTGRMFMNWQRVKAKLPILIIKESEKAEYYKWFD